MSNQTPGAPNPYSGQDSFEDVPEQPNFGLPVPSATTAKPNTPTAPVGHLGTRVQIEEKPAFHLPCALGLLVTIGLFSAGVLVFLDNPNLPPLGILLIVLGLVCASSVTIISPGGNKSITVFRPLYRHYSSAGSAYDCAFFRQENCFHQSAKL